MLIDLSLDCAPTGEPTVADPVGRVPLEGVETAPYVLYPVCDQLADKLCAAKVLQRKSRGGFGLVPLIKPYRRCG